MKFEPVVRVGTSVFNDCTRHALQALITSCAEQNADSFTDAVRDYDSISRLDQWYTSILLRIKKSIEGDGSLR